MAGPTAEHDAGASVATEATASASRAAEAPARPGPTRQSTALEDPRTSETIFDPSALPAYARSLLRIRVPVMVTLAAKKQPVKKIVELMPGSIIQFNKSCEEMLELEVSGRRVALGECVKVGDKFGLRVTSFVLPDERFEKVRSS